MYNKKNNKIKKIKNNYFFKKNNLYIKIIHHLKN